MSDVPAIGAVMTTSASGRDTSGSTSGGDLDRRAAVRAAADRHSRRVRTFKIVLPALGVAALLLVGGLTWVKLRYQSGIDVRNVLFSKEGLTMVEPRLTGRAEGRSYDVSAARAFQNLSDPKVVRLERIDGRIDMDDGSAAKIAAGNGVYDGNRESLALIDGVTITTTKGWRAEGAAADVDLVGGHIYAKGGVRITGPSAAVTADTLDLTENGHHAVFVGNVRMTVVPGGGDEESKPSSDPSR